MTALTALLVEAAQPRWQELGLRGDCALWLARCGLPLAEALSLRMSRTPHGVLLAGVAGAQGTGKSSACELLVPLLAAGYGLRTLVLSLDDFYLPKAARVQLATQVHPLLATRGVPAPMTCRVYTTVCSHRAPQPSAAGSRCRASAKRRTIGCRRRGWCTGASTWCCSRAGA